MCAVVLQLQSSRGTHNQVLEAPEGDLVKFKPLQTKPMEEPREIYHGSWRARDKSLQIWGRVLGDWDA